MGGGQFLFDGVDSSTHADNLKSCNYSFVNWWC